MPELLQVEEVVHLHDAPKLLVEWSPRWHEFRTSLRPALSRSEARLAGEAPFGLIPMRVMVSACLLEGFLIFCAIVVPAKIAELRPYVAPQPASHEVIYYSGDELPKTEDVGGSQAGATGRSGGSEAHHRTQTIRVARGHSLTPQVVDAPDLKLPASRDAVANLLAVKPNAGPPPLEGARSSRTAPSLSAAVVAPAPNVIRDYTRNGIAMNTVVPPAPNFSREQPLTAPTLNTEVIPPAPNLPSPHALIAPALGPAVIPPAPRVTRDRMNHAPTLNANVVAPAPNLQQNSSRTAPAVSATVIPPAPGGVSRDISSAPVQMANAAVVPPPVSAPERVTTRNPKLALPSPNVIAPPPSGDVSQDMRHLASGSVPDPSKSVVPPPPTQSGSGSLLSSIIGKVFGASQVVPPPPNVNPGGSRQVNGTGTSLANDVVPPPPSVAAASGGNPAGQRNGAGATLGGTVIAPPPSSGLTGGNGNRSTRAAAAPSLGPPSVVPPPPALSGPGGGAGNTGGGAGTAGGTLLANNVVPPPPSVSGGSSANGSGLGRSGNGMGGVMDVGSAAAPPTSGGSGSKTGVVISNTPGSKVGRPDTGSGGSLAMSPSGGDKPGLGGSGGGAGIGHGNGPGGGLTGEGTGAARSGSGRGSDPSARGGISPSTGRGGTGSDSAGNPSVPGVAVSGGSTIVTLPSFGSDPAANDPSTPGRSGIKQQDSFGVDVVANGNSGSAFEPYRDLLHGEKHITYLDTFLGEVVMEYADETASGRTRGGVLQPPRSIRTDLPSGLPHARMVVACSLDASGNLKNIRVLEPGPAQMTAQVLAAMRSWKFQPAMRGDQPLEVTAILGFGINTNDRF